jgi:DNA-binding IclR family transcriptional regulator
MARTTSIQALDRSVALLEALSAAGPQGVSLKQLTETVGLRASTGRTLLSSMVEHGLVAQNEQTRRYLLGPLVFELERQYVAQSDLSAVAAPVLRKLWKDTRETVHLAVLQGSRRVDIAVLVSPQLLNINPTTPPSTNEAAPLYRTAAGKVLLAAAPWTARQDDVPANLFEEMDRVREQGYATNFEEEAVGVCGVAAPVHDHSGRTVAALCLGYPSVRHDPAHDAVLRSAVMDAAAELSALLGCVR